MISSFDIRLTLTRRATFKPFDASDYEDASEMFLALSAFLGEYEGNFEVRIDTSRLHFDIEPDLSSVFEDLPLELVNLRELDGAEAEIYFFEQGTDIRISMQRQGEAVRLQVEKGRYVSVANRPFPDNAFFVELNGFLACWTQFLQSVLDLLKKGRRYVLSAESYKEYQAVLRRIRPE